MAKIGVMTTEFDAATFEDVADQVAQLQLTCVQLQLGSVIRDVSTSDALLYGLDVLGVKITEDLATYSREVLASRGLEIAAVDGTYNMIHPDPDRRSRNLEHLIALINLAPVFGTDIVTLCTGSRSEVMWRGDPANQTDDAWRDLLDQMGCR